MVNAMSETVQHDILADGRWQGQHGIGRFSTEVLTRLTNTDTLLHGPKPLSLRNLLWQKRLLAKHPNYKIFFSPGFNPALSPKIPFTFTIHDLIHLKFPGKAGALKKSFYEYVIKPAAKKARIIFTVSTYSKNDILNWINLPEDKVVVVGNGISDAFTPDGIRYRMSSSYLLHVGNMKDHKNVPRLLEAFAQARIDKKIKLICTSDFSQEAQHIIEKYQLTNRVAAITSLPETQLADLYRGAIGITLPSLHEGFGLPVIEGMACGVPVLTSSTTSLPEVAGDAALLVDPYDVAAIAHGVESLVQDERLRQGLINKGLKQAAQFSWHNTASKIQQTLDSLLKIGM